jgi:large subunit ribosomal protein L15
MLLSKILKPNFITSKKTKLGRGYGTGHGGHTATRGQKGQKSRTGHRKAPWYFEGGQLPLVKRLPHNKGFKNPNKKNYLLLQTSSINALAEKELTPKKLVSLGVYPKLNKWGVKVLKDEEVTVPVKMAGFIYSKSAAESIVKAKGEAK